jgi:hypothetical protein
MVGNPPKHLLHCLKRFSIVTPAYIPFEKHLPGVIAQAYCRQVLRYGRSRKKAVGIRFTGCYNDKFS